MKRILAFLMSLLLALSLCACTITEVNAPTTEPTVVTDPVDTESTTPSTDATEGTEATVPNTDPTWHLQEVANKLAGYAIDFNWNDSVVTLILTVGLPDLDMFDRVEKEDDVTYDIYLTDNTSYEVVLDAKTGEVLSIHNNVDNPTERDSYYKS